MLISGFLVVAFDLICWTRLRGVWSGQTWACQCSKSSHATWDLLTLISHKHKRGTPARLSSPSVTLAPMVKWEFLILSHETPALCLLGTVTFSFNVKWHPLLRAANSPLFCRKFPENKPLFPFSDEQIWKSPWFIWKLCPYLCWMFLNISLIIGHNLPDCKMQMLATLLSIHLKLFKNLFFNDNFCVLINLFIKNINKLIKVI